MRKGSTELLKVFSEGLTTCSPPASRQDPEALVEKRFMLTKSVRDAIILYGALAWAFA